jgi:hypothetical protein
MASEAHHGAMLTPIAYLEGLGLQRRKLNGWGPPQQDYLPRDYAVKAPRSSRAARAVFSAVIPSFSRTRAPGALAPKRSIDTTRSTQRYHP